MNETFQYGPSNSGKTVLLSVMANLFTYDRKKIHENGFFLVPKDLLGSNQLADLYESMTLGVFPPGTLPGTSRNYEFRVFYENSEKLNKEIPQLNFSIFDYAGEDITNISGEFTIKLGEKLDQADQYIIVIDGFSLLNYLKIQSGDIDFSKLNLGRRRFSMAKYSNMITKCRTSNNGRKNKRVAVVISKSDFVVKYISITDLIHKTKEIFNDILPYGSVIIPVSSTGSEVTEDEIIVEREAIGDKVVDVHRLIGKIKNPSFLEPFNIDVLLSFIFTEFMNREQDKLRKYINLEIEKVESKACEDSDAIEEEIKKQIEELSKTPNNPIGKFLVGIFDKFKKTTRIGETKDEKIHRLRKELDIELERIRKVKGGFKAKYENHPDLKEYAEILDSVNQKIVIFLKEHPEALISESV